MAEEHTDEALAIAVQAGERESFGLLVERYEEKISRYGRKFLSDSEHITDLVQEIFLKAYVNIQSFDATRSFSPWLYRIAHNEFVNALRKRASASFLSLDWSPDIFLPQLVAEEEADQEAEQRILRGALESSLNLLDDKYREPIVLSYFQDLTYQEIADVLQIPISTVGVRLTRGKALLKKLYQEKYGTEQ